MNSKSYCLSINDGQNHQSFKRLFFQLLFVAAVCAVLPQTKHSQPMELSTKWLPLAVEQWAERLLI